MLPTFYPYSKEKFKSYSPVNKEKIDSLSALKPLP